MLNITPALILFEIISAKNDVIIKLDKLLLNNA
jgi:hypothetical protein